MSFRKTGSAGQVTGIEDQPGAPEAEDLLDEHGFSRTAAAAWGPQDEARLAEENAAADGAPVIPQPRTSG